MELGLAKKWWFLQMSVDNGKVPLMPEIKPGFRNKVKIFKIISKDVYFFK